MPSPFCTCIFLMIDFICIFVDLLFLKAAACLLQLEHLAQSLASGFSKHNQDGSEEWLILGLGQGRRKLS